MPYQLIAFDDVSLPLAMPVDDLSSGHVPSGLQESIGSAYNYFGRYTTYPRKMQFTHKGLYVGEDDSFRVTPEGDFRVTTAASGSDNRAINSGKLADLMDQVDQLKRKVGAWGQVWRKQLTNGVLTFKYCRLLHVRHEENVNNAGVVSKLDTTFETLDVTWRAAAVTQTTLFIAFGARPLAIINEGAYPVDDALLRVAAASGPITQVKVSAIVPNPLLGATNLGVDLTWNGSLSTGSTLFIDSGAQPLPTGAADAYSGLTVGPLHTSDVWLPLAKGTNLYNITLTGGGATVTMEHYNRYP